MRGLGLEKPATQWKALGLWPKIVGKEIAKLTRPLYVIDKVLFVGTPSSSWANELDFQKREILDRLKKQLGPEAIRDIRFQNAPWKEESKTQKKEMSPRLTPEELKQVQEICGAIENPQIKAQFEKLLIRGMSNERAL